MVRVAGGGCADLERRGADLLRRGDRDPLAFAPGPDPDFWPEGSDPDGDDYGELDESPPPPKRARRTADAMAQREALVDHEIAVRALHTSPWTRNLRNRSVARTKEQD